MQKFNYLILKVILFLSVKSKLNLECKVLLALFIQSMLRNFSTVLKKKMVISADSWKSI